MGSPSQLTELAGCPAPAPSTQRPAPSTQHPSPCPEQRRAVCPPHGWAFPSSSWHCAEGTQKPPFLCQEDAGKVAYLLKTSFEVNFVSK